MFLSQVWISIHGTLTILTHCCSRRVRKMPTHSRGRAESLTGFHGLSGTGQSVHLYHFLHLTVYYKVSSKSHGEINTTCQGQHGGDFNACLTLFFFFFSKHQERSNTIRFLLQNDFFYFNI